MNNLAMVESVDVQFSRASTFSIFARSHKERCAGHIAGGKQSFQHENIGVVHDHRGRARHDRWSIINVRAANEHSKPCFPVVAEFGFCGESLEM